MATRKKKVTIGKGMKESASKVRRARKKPGGSNVGAYNTVAKKDFAGTKGGAPKGSYPINTLLALASVLMG